MKRVGATLKTVASIVGMTEFDVFYLLKEIEKTPFKNFYEEKDGYYYGNVVEAIKYYKIVKQSIL